MLWVVLLIQDTMCTVLYSPGTVGYVGTSYFVKKIYSTVKID